MAIGRRTKETPEATATPDITPEEKQQVVQRASNEVTVEVMGNRSSFDEDVLRDATFDELVELTTAAHGPIVEAGTVLGDGFTLINNKDLLCGVPTLFMEWHFNDGDFGRFVSVRAVAKLPGGVTGKYIFNDGSTGLMDQLAKYTKKTDRTGGMLVRKGLRRSDYTYEDPTTAEQRPATTYYIDTSSD